MTLHDAIRMMGAAAVIETHSDATLAGQVAQLQAADVREHQARRQELPHKAAVIPALGLNANLQLRPIDAMLELARGTALHDDPEVAAFASRWSVLRYLGIFARNPQTLALHLDGVALQFIGPNQRRVLSEELGIGFGIVAAKHWCRTRVPEIGPIKAIDVDRALHDGTVANLDLVGGRQADYLLAYPDPSSPNAMIYNVLETKGTVSKSTAKKQLGRAVTQLAGLTVDGRQMTGIATSTVSNEFGLVVMAVDPEEREVSWEATPEALTRWRFAPSRSRSDDVRLDVTADELFARATNADNASLAQFGGMYDASRRWLPSLGTRDAEAQQPNEVRRTTDEGTFVGAEVVIEMPASRTRVRLYQGVEEHIAAGLRALDDTAVTQAQRAFAVTRTRTSEIPALSDKAVSAVALSSDGSILEISVDSS